MTRTTVSGGFAESFLRPGLMLLAAFALPAVAGQVRAEGRGDVAQAELLVDLARDHGLMARGKQTAADVRQVRALLRAAQRLDPNNWEAALWTYELAALEGDDAGARAALDRLVAIDPHHHQAFTLWLEAHARQHQSLEKRREWLTGLLDNPRPPFAEACVRAQLAGLALERLDRAAAREQLERARALDPLNPEAAVLAIDVTPPEAPAHERLAVLLRALQLRPLRADIAWRIALLLDEVGAHADAARLFDHAVAIESRSGAALSTAMRLELMRNHAARGEIDQAVEIGRAGLEAARDDAEFQMLHFWLAQRASRPFDVGLMRVRLDKLLAQVKEPDEWPVQLVAQAAWYHCTIEPLPERALALAEAAVRRAPGDAFAKRVLGWAQILSGRSAEGRETLSPLSGKDPFAAYQVARLMKQEGDEAGAIRIVQELGYVPRSTYAFDLLSGLGLPSLTSQPAELSPELRAALGAFNPEVMAFATEPARFLEARIEMDRPTFEPGRPWGATFTLTNRASFPIPLGPEGLVNPTFLLSISMEGDRKRQYPSLMTVSVDTVRMLAPGQSAQVSRRLSVGPPHRAALLTPQQIQRMTLTAVLDAQLDRQGAWQPGPTGQRLRGVSFNRLPAACGPDAWNAMMATLRDGRDTDRGRVIAILGQLLGEQQRNARQPLPYRPQPVPSDQIEAIFVSVLRGESDDLRIAALNALMVAGLDQTLAAAAEACLNHDHWVVRLMALRLLARQGAAFLDQARRIAESDTDESVRDLARSYVERWTSAASQPSSTGDDAGP